MKHQNIFQLRIIQTNTTNYICKVCGAAFDNGYNLDTLITGTHHPKRTVTVNDIVNSIFKGQMNFPKTKAEIVKYIEVHKDDDPAITPPGFGGN
jgi:hypothetical protein